MSVSQRLADLGIELPAVAAPVAAYVPAVRAGTYVYTSGQLPIAGGELTVTGTVGATVGAAEAAAGARIAALNALAAAASVAGGIDHIARIVKVTVFVASTPDFTGQPGVANGASEVLTEIFGTPHARSAVGCAALPLGVPVEVEVIAEIV
ncbi:MAG: RidA family protein [Ruaniaceae bacterium]|nr:RidA family protein [Ruaniaceae bacterium]